MTQKTNYSVNHKSRPKILNQLDATKKMLMSVHMYMCKILVYESEQTTIMNKHRTFTK